MAEADRLRLAARQESDYAGFGYAPLLDDDLRAIAAVAGDVAGDSAAAITSAETASTQAGIATTQATSATASAAAAAADRAQTGLDRTQTGLDRTATAADRVQTGLDRAQTGLDRTTTAADAAATAADRVQTGLDRTSATSSAASASNSASTATTQAGIATTQATAAATSRTQAEGAVASVTVGSTNSLAYPEQVRNLVTAADVVDVMIYDTRLDSDGGAWTERCSGTTWFQEALNTATRGAKRAFPKVALIVARQTSLTIYDALELDGSSVPRMWMTFDGTSTNFMLSTDGGAFITGIAARNGRIYRTANTGSQSVVVLDFVEDTALRITSAAPTTGSARDGIASRNAVGVFNPRYSASAVVPQPLSIDAIVLPGAPLNRLGLPVPTLVVATNASLVVVHPLDSFSTRGATVTLTGGYTRARFTADNRIIAIGATAPSIADVGPIPYAATVANTAWRTHRIGASSIGATGGVILPAQLTVNSGASLVDVLPDAAPQPFALNLIAEDAGDVANSMVAAVGATFNSGWMLSNGIQLATCCEGTTGTATASGNLLTNGDFATGDLTGWTASNVGTGAAASVSGNVLVLPRIDTNNIARVVTTFTTIIGETYRVSFDQVVAAGVNISVGTTLLGFQNGNFFGPIGATIGRGAVQFTATATTTHLLFAAQTNGVTSQIDNISVNLATRDRSHRQNGLDVVGALSRTAVGTGNDVVGWGGFSAANYLTQPSNAALAVGTGDVMVAAWVNVSSFAAAFPVALAQGSDAIQLGVTAVTGFNFRLQSSTATTDLTVNGTTQPSAQWVFVVGLRRAGVMELWVNGVREATLAAAGTLTATPGALEVGRSDNASVMSAALLRVATYAPTPAQIERMFRDERPLFQPGARAFLGGASSATVRRVARSRFSNRLAVSMSDGLTVMDGLQRVERHTTATLSPAMASNSVTPVAMESGLMLIGTASNAGVRRDAITGLDRMPSNQPTPASPRVFRARGVTADATPLIIAPRIPIGERETVVVTAIIVARVYGASDTERLTYERRATYFRDAGGNITLAGAVQVVGTDVEVTGTADATLVIDTTAQTIAAQVTGIAATRLVWTVRYQIERSTHETTYEETV